MTKRRDRAFFGEHRLPACSCRQLAGNILQSIVAKLRDASRQAAEMEQASDLCSPDKEEKISIGVTRHVPALRG
jgi:hypothetical protein